MAMQLTRELTETLDSQIHLNTVNELKMLICSGKTLENARVGYRYKKLPDEYRRELYHMLTAELRPFMLLGKKVKGEEIKDYTNISRTRAEIEKEFKQKRDTTLEKRPSSEGSRK